MADGTVSHSKSVVTHDDDGRKADKLARRRASRARWLAKHPGYHAAYQAALTAKKQQERAARPRPPETIHYSGPVVTLAEARAFGAKRYFSGAACKFGHIGERATVNQRCLVCAYTQKRHKREAARKPKPPLPPITVFHEGDTISRDEAAAQGLKTFFTGIPCPKGHIAIRTVSSKGCRACDNERAARFRCEQAEWYKARWARYRTPKHLEKARQSAAARYRADPGGERAKAKARRVAKPEQYRTLVRNRRARRKDAEGTFTPEEFLTVLKAQKWRCAMCRISLKKKVPEADHITPLAKGGSNYIRNIQALCKSCNRQKSARDPIDYAQGLGLLL